MSGFSGALLEHPQVVRGEIDTEFIEREISALTPRGAGGHGARFGRGMRGGARARGA